MIKMVLFLAHEVWLKPHNSARRQKRALCSKHSHSKLFQGFFQARNLTSACGYCEIFEFKGSIQRKVINLNE